MKKYTAAIMFFVLLAGCSSSLGFTGYVKMPLPTTEVTNLSVNFTGSQNIKLGVQVETVGKDTVVTWFKNGRKFIFKDMTGYTGELHIDSAYLEIGDVKIFIDERWLKVEAPSYKISQELTGFYEEGKNLIITPGGVKAED
ncbi:MAG: hypothetical protein V1701_04460 [Planctomycetota bacterium]